jgi:hypothetical protein
MLEADRDQIDIFVNALFRYADQRGFVSLRAFHDNSPNKVFRINPTGLSGGLGFLIDVAVDEAYRAANSPEPVVFCPPIAVFSNKERAREQDIIEGLALSVECDERASAAKAKLEEIFGPVTLAVKSGGKWKDPATGELQDKLHLHWRLSTPARGEELAVLKQARDLAARLVGGDPSNKPVCHPIRWPGSWHRKGEPVLCAIQERNPDREIDLASALAALMATTPIPTPHDDSDTILRAPSGTLVLSPAWAEQVNGIISGTDYHGPIASLAMKFLIAGMSDGAVVEMLRGLMDNSIAPHDTRWQARFDDIPRAVSTARQKIAERPRQLLELQSSWQFTESFVPPDPLMSGILQRRFIYALTGHTGRGKTAVALLLAAHVALGRPMGNLDVEKGRVLVLAGENPTDAQMRWIAMSQLMSFERGEIDVYWIKGTFKISECLEHMRQEVEQLGGVDFIIVDSSAAFFEGDDENNNSQQGAHARLLRSLTNLPGDPCVLVLCHPPKNASEDNLQPRGGGAYVAEMDGNLTITKDNMTVELHWQTKLRGPDFAPVSFMLHSVTLEELKDTKGRMIPTVVAEHLSEKAQEEIAEASRRDEDQVLQTLANDPRISLASMAMRQGWKMRSGAPNRSKVQRILSHLQRDKLIKQERKGGHYEITDKGKKALKQSGAD